MPASTAHTPPSVANAMRQSYFIISMASSRSVTATRAFSATSVLSSSTTAFTSFSLHRKGCLRSSCLALLLAQQHPGHCQPPSPCPHGSTAAGSAPGITLPGTKGHKIHHSCLHTPTATIRTPTSSTGPHPANTALPNQQDGCAAHHGSPNTPGAQPTLDFADSRLGLRLLLQDLHDVLEPG